LDFALADAGSRGRLYVFSAALALTVFVEVAASACPDPASAISRLMPAIAGSPANGSLHVVPSSCLTEAASRPRPPRPAREIGTRAPG